MSHHFSYTEMRGLFFGRKIGEGSTRKVFACRIDESVVIKKEMKAGGFQNVLEWEIWRTVSYSETLAPWFAPCFHLSGSGTLLIQARTSPIATLKDLPKKIPSFFTDLKKQNWGWYEGRPVCHDYATISIKYFSEPIKMVKADWWHEKGH